MTHTATHCNTLQHTATHCNTLHHTATHRIPQQDKVVALLVRLTSAFAHAPAGVLSPAHHALVFQRCVYVCLHTFDIHIHVSACIHLCSLCVCIYMDLVYFVRPYIYVSTHVSMCILSIHDHTLVFKKCLCKCVCVCMYAYLIYVYRRISVLIYVNTLCIFANASVCVYVYVCVHI